MLSRSAYKLSGLYEFHIELFVCVPKLNTDSNCISLNKNRLIINVPLTNPFIWFVNLLLTLYRLMSKSYVFQYFFLTFYLRIPYVGFITRSLVYIFPDSIFLLFFSPFTNLTIYHLWPTYICRVDPLFTLIRFHLGESIFHALH